MWNWMEEKRKYIKDVFVDENYYYLYSNALTTHCGAYKEFQLKQYSYAMTMQTLTPIVLQELIDKIEVFPIEGTGKNRTQRFVIHYRFVGCIDLLSIVPKHTYKLDSRQGVAIEYLPSAV